MGIEYIGALKKLNSKIEPVCIKRDNSFISATQIRDEILNNSIKNVQNYVPSETYELLNNNYILNENIFKILRYGYFHAIFKYNLPSPSPTSFTNNLPHRICSPNCNHITHVTTSSS